MLCNNCKKNKANTFFRQTVNGYSKELFLCPECASKMNLTDIFGMPVILSSFFGQMDFNSDYDGKQSLGFLNDPKNELDILRKKMNDSVKIEDYESAAKFRDQIKKIEASL